MVVPEGLRDLMNDDFRPAYGFTDAVASLRADGVPVGWAVLGVTVGYTMGAGLRRTYLSDGSSTDPEAVRGLGKALITDAYVSAVKPPIGAGPEGPAGGMAFKEAGDLGLRMSLGGKNNV